MKEQKTLLELIREKESELNVQLELAIKEAGTVLSRARTESDRILREAEANGERLVDEYHRGEKAKISLEVEEIKSSRAKRKQMLREAGEKNLPKAVNLIVDAVAPR